VILACNWRACMGVGLHVFTNVLWSKYYGLGADSLMNCVLCLPNLCTSKVQVDIRSLPTEKNGDRIALDA
jgi:hypothetical protein